MQYRTKVAIVYLLGFFIDLINMFITNVAYPAIGLALNASVDQLTWVSTSYILGLILITPISAWLALRIGGRRVFLLSLTLFLVTTVMAGFANSIELLIGLRLLQGLSGGLLIPIGQTLTYQLYASHERARLSSIIMLVGLLAPALSPALGGLIVDQLNWRWVFFVNLPLTLIALVLAFVWLRSDKVSFPKDSHFLDVRGLAIASVGLTLLLLGLDWLAVPNKLFGALILLITAVAVLVYYVRHSFRHPKPLLDLGLIRNPLLRISMMVYLFIPGVFMGVNLIAMMYLQMQLGMSASSVGVLMIPWSLSAFLAIMLVGKLFNYYGPKPLFMLGCLIQGIGILCLSQITMVDQPLLLLISFSLMGFGGSLCSSAAQSSAFLTIDCVSLADASAIWNINRQFSFCVGVAVMSLILQLLQMTVDSLSAYQISFYLAAAVTAVPFLLCLYIDNKAVLKKINA